MIMSHMTNLARRRAKAMRIPLRDSDTTFNPEDMNTLDSSINAIIDNIVTNIDMDDTITNFNFQLIGDEPAPIEENSNNRWTLHFWIQVSKGFLGKFKVEFSVGLYFGKNTVVGDKKLGTMEVSRNGNIKDFGLSNKVISLFKQARDQFIAANKRSEDENINFKPDNENDLDDAITQVVSSVFGQYGKFVFNLVGKESDTGHDWVIKIKIMSVKDNGKANVDFRYSVTYNDEKIIPDAYAGRIVLYNDGNADDTGVISEIEDNFIAKREELISKTAKALKRFYFRKGLR